MPTRSRNGPEFIDNAYLSGEWASTFADLQRPVESARFARRSIAVASQHSRARREVFSQAALARAALTRHDLDTALRAAHRAVDHSTTVQSSRCIAAVRDLQTRIGPYRTLAPAREFDDHARESLTQANLNYGGAQTRTSAPRPATPAT